MFETWARGQYDIHKILNPEGAKCPRVSVLSYCLSVHILTSIASVDITHIHFNYIQLSAKYNCTAAKALYIIKLLYNSTVSMATDATSTLHMLHTCCIHLVLSPIATTTIFEHVHDDT